MSVEPTEREGKEGNEERGPLVVGVKGVCVRERERERERERDRES